MGTSRGVARGPVGIDTRRLRLERFARAAIPEAWLRRIQARRVPAENIPRLLDSREGGFVRDIAQAIRLAFASVLIVALSTLAALPSAAEIQWSGLLDLVAAEHTDAY